jgi:hypothetical protein
MLHHTLLAAQHKGSDPLKQLQEIGIAYVDFAMEHSSHYRLMFGAYGATSAQHYPELGQATTQAFMVLVDCVKTGQQQGVIRLDDSNQLALAAWSLTHGLAMLLIDNQISLTISQPATSLSSFVTQVLVEGLTRYGV